MNFMIAGKVASYAGGLDALKDDDRLRHLGPRTGIDFSSNDYLALASAPHMKKAIVTALEAGTPIGAGRSWLLRGNCEERGCLEAAAAWFFGVQTVPFFGRGYIANFAVLTTLPHATTCSSSILWFTPAFKKEHELAEPRFESAPVTTRRLSKAQFATGVPRAERGGSGS